MKLIIDIDCDLLNRIREAKSVPDMYGADIVNTINIIKSGIPTYDRPTGKWIAREDMDYLDENRVVHNHFECNKCGFIHDFIDGHTSQYNFCPNCGAKMEKPQTQKFADNDTAYGGLASAT